MEQHYRLTNPFLHYGILVLIVGSGFLTLFSHALFHTGHNHEQTSSYAAQSAATEVCSGQPVHTYRLTFNSRTITPAHITAKRCDELTIINNNDDVVVAALGPHEHHIHYPGFTETPLSHGQTYSFRLSETGSFPLHDHDNDSLRASLIVKD